jgi:acyl dehydratase
VSSLSLVPPETLAMVGQPLGPPVTALITRREAQRYARAVGDLSPLYFDEEAARAAGYDGLVAPPTFVGHAMVEGGALEDIRIDGIWIERGPRLHLRVSRTMFGGEEWEFPRPVLVGDTITAQRRLGAVEEKEGRAGPFVLTHFETTFTNQHGDVVAVSRLVGIAR